AAPSRSAGPAPPAGRARRAAWSCGRWRGAGPGGWRSRGRKWQSVAGTSKRSIAPAGLVSAAGAGVNGWKGIQGAWAASPPLPSPLPGGERGQFVHDALFTPRPWRERGWGRGAAAAPKQQTPPALRLPRPRPDRGFDPRLVQPALGEHFTGLGVFDIA